MITARAAAIVVAAVASAVLSMPAAHAQTKLRLACPSAPATPTCMAATHFADGVKKETGGAVEVQVFPSGQLGTGPKAILATQTGSVDLVVEDLVNYANLVKDYGILGWGFAFKDSAHLDRFLDSPAHAAMRKELADKAGITLLAYKWKKLPRVVVSTRPVFIPDDLKGLKFRVPNIKTYIATWQSLGANPTQVPWGESFLALRQGTVDAMESPFESIVGQKFHQAAKYVTMTNHVVSALSLGANAKRIAALTDAQRAAFAKSAEATTAYIADLVDAEGNQAVDAITGDGAYVILMDSAPFAKRIEAAAAQMESDGLWRKGLLADINKLR